MIERKLSGEKPKSAMPPGATDTQMHMYLPGFPALPGGPELPEGLPGPDDYRKVMDWLGIERVVITQGNAQQRDNANLIACLKAMGQNARGVAAITGETPEAEMDVLHEAGEAIGQGVALLDSVAELPGPRRLRSQLLAGGGGVEGRLRHQGLEVPLLEEHPGESAQGGPLAPGAQGLEGNAEVQGFQEDVVAVTARLPAALLRDRRRTVCRGGRR